MGVYHRINTMLPPDLVEVALACLSLVVVVAMVRRMAPTHMFSEIYTPLYASSCQNGVTARHEETICLCRLFSGP